MIRGLQMRVRSLSSTSDYASSLERTPRKVTTATGRVDVVEALWAPLCFESARGERGPTRSRLKGLILVPRSRNARGLGTPYVLAGLTCASQKL